MKYYLNLKEALLKARNNPNLTLVERSVHKNGKTFIQHFWVLPSEIKPTDIVIKRPKESLINRSPNISNNELIDYETNWFFHQFSDKEEALSALHTLGIKWTESSNETQNYNNAVQAVKNTLASGRNLTIELPYLNSPSNYTPEQYMVDAFKFQVSFKSRQEFIDAMKRLGFKIRWKHIDDQYDYATQLAQTVYDNGYDLAKEWQDIQTNQVSDMTYSRVACTFLNKFNFKKDSDLEDALKLLGITDLKQAISDGVDLIELYKDKTSKLHTLLEGEHWSAIRNYISNVPPEYKSIKTLWEAYEDKFLSEIDTSDKAIFCYIGTSSGVISFPGLQSIDNLPTQRSIPYWVIFHEAGHAIDFRLGNEQFSYNYKNHIFYTTLREEAKEFLKKAGIDDYTDESNKEKLFQLNQQLNDYDLYGFQDIVNGATDGIALWGHDKDYWAKSKHNLCTEAFANMTADIITNNEEGLYFLKTYFPKSFKIYLEMTEELAKNI